MVGVKSQAQIAASKIARKRLGIETLEPRGSDRFDFHDLHVASIRAAFEEAFAAGEETTRGDRFVLKEGDVRIVERGTNGHAALLPDPPRLTGF
jgi:hypothetical protein